jgi:(2Fe-2S) ferredoxin
VSAFPRPAERCAVRADARADHMLGTAFPAARLLLVEQPFPWGPEGLRTSRFDRETALALEARGRAEGVRVQAIRGLGRDTEHARRRWYAVDTRDATRGMTTGEYTDDADLLELPLDGSAGVPDAEPLYLVCTHGRHDPCCAQRGRPIVAALTAARPGRVWQASHLGGCRFAPTVLTVPDGIMYGRLPPDAGDALVAATESGEVLGEFLRGRIGIPPTAQAAVCFAQEQLGLPHIRDLAVVSTVTLDRGTAVVRVEGEPGRFDVTVALERVDAPALTCAHPGDSWFVAHRPMAIEPAPGR